MKIAITATIILSIGIAAICEAKSRVGEGHPPSAGGDRHRPPSPREGETSPPGFEDVTREPKPDHRSGNDTDCPKNGTDKPRQPPSRGIRRGRHAPGGGDRKKESKERRRDDFTHPPKDFTGEPPHRDHRESHRKDHSGDHTHAPGEGGRKDGPKERRRDDYTHPPKDFTGEPPHRDHREGHRKDHSGDHTHVPEDHTGSPPPRKGGKDGPSGKGGKKRRP